jgi:hypothetical protein
MCSFERALADINAYLDRARECAKKFTLPAANIKNRGVYRYTISKLGETFDFANK